MNRKQKRIFENKCIISLVYLIHKKTKDVIRLSLKTIESPTQEDISMTLRNYMLEHPDFKTEDYRLNIITLDKKQKKILLKMKERHYVKKENKKV